MKMVSLGDRKLFSILLGQSPPSVSYNRTGIGLPFYQGKSDFGFMYPRASMWCTEPIRIAQKGDVLISVRAPVGPVNIASEECCIGRGLAAIRPGTDVDSAYLFWILKGYEKRIAHDGSGSVFDAITKDQLLSISIPMILDIGVQKDIVRKIEISMDRIHKLEELLVKQQIEVDCLRSSILRRHIPARIDKPSTGGWRWLPLSSLLSHNKTSIGSSKVMTRDYLNTGNYPIVDQGKRFIAGYTNDIRKVLKFDTPVIVFGDHTRCVKFIDFDFAVGADGVKVLVPNTTIINAKYFYYLLTMLDVPNDGYSRHYKYLSTFQYLVPDIETQCRIVSELDDKLNLVTRLMDDNLATIQFVGELKESIIQKLCVFKKEDK